MKRKALLVFALCIAIGCMVRFGTQQAMADDKPKYGGVIVVASGKAPLSFGYPLKIRGYDQECAAPALEFLVNKNRKGVVEPHLAESWEVSPDGKSYTFKLQKGVKFHDGTDFNAQAVKYNLEQWKKKKSSVLKKLKSIDVIDDHTVRLNLSEYDALVLFELSVECYMASPSAIEKNGEKWAETHPVGTGPFKLKNFERNVTLLYERNENYWQKGLPYLDGVEFKTVKNSMTQVAALKTGKIDVIYDVLMKHAKMLEKQGYVLKQWDHNMVGLYGDSKNPDSPWSKKKVREAAEYAIDKETIMTVLGEGYPEALYQFVSSKHPFNFPDLKPRKYDPERAKKLLAEAGYPNGFKSELTHYAPMWPEMYVALQADLAKVGIDLKINSVDKPKYYEIKFNQGVLKNGISHCNYPAGASIVHGFKGFFATESGQHQDIALPAGFDVVVDKMLLEPDAAKQEALIHKASKMLCDEESFIPLFIEPRLAALTKSIHGVDYTGYVHPNTYQFLKAWKARN